MLKLLKIVLYKDLLFIGTFCATVFLIVFKILLKFFLNEFLRVFIILFFLEYYILDNNCVFIFKFLYVFVFDN